MIKSTDSGASWTPISLIGYTTAARNRTLESALVLIGSDLHVMGRTTTTSYNHFISTDSGATWTTAAAITGVLASKPCAINYYKSDGSTLDVVCAFNITSEITGAPHRTTLGIYTTSDFVSFVEVGKIVTTNFAHYPSLCFFDRALYMSYTKGLKSYTVGQNAYAYDRDTIVVTRIY